MTMSLKFFVLIKQVPSTQNLKIDKKKGTIIREGIENIINPDDLYALELGISLREQYGGKVTAMTMGPPQAELALREALAMGVDDAILISDPIFAYSDTLQTTLVLKEAFNLIEEYDIIITGSRTSDSSTGQVPFQLSEALDIPLITDIFSMSLENNILKAHRNFGHESQNIVVKFPILIKVVRHFNKPRHVSLLGIKRAFEKKIQIINFNTLNCPAHLDGCNQSPTKVVKIVEITHERKNEFIQGNVNEKLTKLITLMKEHGIEKTWTGGKN